MLNAHNHACMQFQTGLDLYMGRHQAFRLNILPGFAITILSNNSPSFPSTTNYNFRCSVKFVTLKVFCPSLKGRASSEPLPSRPHVCFCTCLSGLELGKSFLVTPREWPWDWNYWGQRPQRWIHSLWVNMDWAWDVMEGMWEWAGVQSLCLASTRRAILWSVL